MVGLTYPGVFDSISNSQITGKDFLITWILIAGFSMIFSLAGAALGHLSFAPLRPMPARSSSRDSIEEEAVNISSKHIDEQSTIEVNADDIPVENLTEKPFSQTSQPSMFSSFLTILIIGLSPIVAAYIFSAGYDFILSLNQFVPGPYPTLRILSALLPWQIPIPIDLNSGIQNIIIFSRI